MIGDLRRFSSIGPEEIAAGMSAMHAPLSGYLAGEPRGGREVCELEQAWAEKFNVTHAIACNSATSGLLAAAFATGLGDGDRFAVSAMTMSATAAAPMFTGARPFFGDVDDETFGIETDLPHSAPVFATNLFGHAAHLTALRNWCDSNKTVLIEDNSQSPFASVGEQFTGTIGHIGVFSLNIHKPIQCGEGGMIVTDDDELADRLRAFINHGEHVGRSIGLNLRMPEVCAAIARVQLRHGEEIVQGRIDQATAIITAVSGTPGIRMPVTRDRCRHVYYTIPFLIDGDRAAFCASLREDGVPIVEGYVDPLYRMPAFAKWARPCPVAEGLHDRRLFYAENCAWDFTRDQVEQIGEAFRKAAKCLKI
jgi:perosamine synthetase